MSLFLLIVFIHLAYWLWVLLTTLFLLLPSLVVHALCVMSSAHVSIYCCVSPPSLASPFVLLPDCALSCLLMSTFGVERPKSHHQLQVPHPTSLGKPMTG